MNHSHQTELEDVHQLSDRELVCLVQTGSHQYFEELVRRYQTRLLNFLARRTVSLEDAEDLLQSTFLRAFEAIERYSPEWTFKTWIFTIAWRLTANSYRKSHPHHHSFTAELLDSQHLSPLDQLIKNEQKSNLWIIAQQKLTDDQFNLLWFTYVEQMPPKELAQLFEKSYSWVKVTLWRARRSLEPYLLRNDDQKKMDCLQTHDFQTNKAKQKKMTETIL